MITFLIKGLIRDRSRSLFPILTVTAGVMMTVILFSWIKGAESNMIESSANFNTGYVKITSRAYAEEADQIPNDLALMGVKTLMEELRKDYPDMIWTPRIRFAGLLDIPDKNGETKAQGPVMGLAADLFSANSPEREILNLKNAVVSGRLPEKHGEILISDDFSKKLGIGPGDTATLISSTMYGSMAMANFTIACTIHFGIAAMDRGAMLADIADIQAALDMDDACGEILGFTKDHIYRDKAAKAMADVFNKKRENNSDEFAPLMKSLKEQGGLAEILAMVGSYSGIIIAVFVFAMSIVLWNSGLMGSLRRYGEIGMRLAMGERKGHLYRTMIGESLIIGLFGSIIGTLLGLAFSYYMQAHGINIGSMMKNASMFLSEVMRAKVTPESYIIGFIPGLLATLLGTSLSGLGIYRRKSTQLIKELET